MDLKRNKKGFTLVELIVVLVIIGILLAMVIPNLTGYIDRAKNKSLEVNARSAYMAVMAIAAEEYAADPTITGLTAGQITEAKELADVPGTISEITIDSGDVTAMTYTETPKAIIYTNGVPGDITG